MKLRISIIALAAMFSMVALTPMVSMAPTEFLAGSRASSTPGEILQSTHAANAGHLGADAPQTHPPSLDNINTILVGTFPPKGVDSPGISPNHLRKTAEMVTKSTPAQTSAQVLAGRLNTLADLVNRRETPSEEIWSDVLRDLTEYLGIHIQHQELRLRQQAATARAQAMYQNIYRLNNLLTTLLDVLPEDTREGIFRRAQEIELNDRRVFTKQHEAFHVAHHGPIANAHTFAAHPKGPLSHHVQGPSPDAHKAFDAEPDPDDMDGLNDS